MKLKHLLMLNGILAIVAGLFVALAWGVVLRWVANLTPDWRDVPIEIWVLGSAIRMAGAALFILGMILIAVRRVADKSTRRALTLGLFIAYSLTTLLALAQQTAIWNSSMGWVIVGVCALLAAGYGYFFGIDLMAELVPGMRPSSQPKEMTYDLEQIRYVTQNYSNLQGLRLIPLGLWLLIVGLVTIEFAIPLLLAAWVLTWLIGVYYNRSFGKVRSLTSPSWKSYLVGLLALAALIAAAVADRYLKLPVNLLGLTMATGLFLTWLQPAYRPRLHYLVVAVLVAAVSLLQLFGIPAANSTFYPVLAGSVGILLVILIGGLFDHLLLVRAFKALPEEESHE
jgi:MFS family permease